MKKVPAPGRSAPKVDTRARLRARRITYTSALRAYLVNRVVGAILLHRARLDAYRRLANCRIGENSTILMGAKFTYPGFIRIGDRSVVNERCYLDGRGGIWIGNDVSIALDVRLVTADHDITKPNFAGRVRSIHIEDHAVVGAGATILPGVRIGRGAIVGAGAVVMRDVAPLTIVIGNPARHAGHRPEEALGYRLYYRPLFE